jgi:hypothetical protein
MVKVSSISARLRRKTRLYNRFRFSSTGTMTMVRFGYFAENLKVACHCAQNFGNVVVVRDGRVIHRALRPVAKSEIPFVAISFYRVKQHDLQNSSLRTCTDKYESRGVFKRFQWIGIFYHFLDRRLIVGSKKVETKIRAFPCRGYAPPPPTAEGVSNQLYTTGNFHPF